MDKWIETPWFGKIIALALAVLLFVTINFEAESNSFSFDTPASEEEATVESIPVEVYYDQDNLVLSGIPKTVDVILSGPKNILIPTVNSRDFSVFVDLSEAQVGKQRITLKVSDLSDKLEYRIEPSYADVIIQEKVTQEFAVEAEYDRNLLEEGYFGSEPVVDPKTVEITGGKEDIDEIAYVKAIVNIEEGANDTIEIDAPIQVLDSSMNKIEGIVVSPETVKVQVDVRSPSKTVDIEPVASGNPSEGTVIDSLTTEPETLTLYGNQSVLDTISVFQLPVDVSKVTKDTSFKVDIDLPEGVKNASVNEVTVNVKAKAAEGIDEEPEQENPDESVDNPTVPDESEPEPEETASKTFPAIRVDYTGLSDGYELLFINPAPGTTDVQVSGSKSAVESLKASDIKVSMNVAGLEEGEHTASLVVKTPDNGVKGQAAVTTASILIKKQVSEASELPEMEEESSQFHDSGFSLIHYRKSIGSVLPKLV